ncbi:MAG: hypothetical protein BM556_13080 [Bacteriovorax sp. MedPE-SWde]|nr:MAG: hypothetical protein BM556_13080 [Bacteriovorax sp. MedPE-SWde]
MKLATLITFIFSLSCFAQSMYLNEAHEYYCSNAESLKRARVRTCSVDISENTNIDPLSGGVENILIKYKDDSFRKLCSRRHRTKWQKVIYTGEDLDSNLLPNSNCACKLMSRTSKELVCKGIDDRSISYQEETKSYILDSLQNAISKKIKGLNTRSGLSNVNGEICKLDKVEGCSNLASVIDSNSEKKRKEDEQKHQNFLASTIELEGKDIFKKSLKRLRKHIKEAGSVKAYIEEKFPNYTHAFGLYRCTLDENQEIRDEEKDLYYSVLGNKALYNSFCKTGDKNAFTSIIEASVKDDTSQNIPIEKFVRDYTEANYERECGEIKKINKVRCEIDKMSPIDVIKYVHSSNQFLIGISFHSDLEGSKRDGIHRRISNLACLLKTEKSETDIAPDVISNLAKYERDFSSGIYNFSTADVSSTKVEAKIEKPLKVAKPKPAPKKRPAKKSKEKSSLDKKEKLEPWRLPGAESIPGIYDARVGAESITTTSGIFIPPEKLTALQGFAEVQNDIEEDRVSGTLTDSKKQAYREIGKEYEAMLGRNVDVFNDSAVELKKQLLTEEGTKVYNNVAKTAAKLSKEIKVLSKKAVTAGPRERVQIKNRLTKIKRELDGHKKYGFNIDFKIPTTSEIMNIGRSTPSTTRGTFLDDNSSSQSDNSFRKFESKKDDPSEDISYSDYQKNFANYSRPEKLDAPQEFYRDTTRPQSQLLPKGNYDKKASPSQSRARMSSAPRSSSGGGRSVASVSSRSSGSGLTLGSSSAGAGSLSQAKTYQVENKSYVNQVLNNEERPKLKVIFVEDLKVMKVFKLNEDKVYEKEGEYSEESFKENYNNFETDVKLDGEQFFRFRVRDMEEMLTK